MRKLLKICLNACAPVVIVASVLTPGPAGASAVAGNGFGDVDEGEYYADAINWMVANGITTGIEPGCFGPGEPVTRGQIAAFMYRLDTALGNAPETVDHPFNDIVFDYQRHPIGWMFGEGVTTGTSPVTFAPDAPVSRGDFAVLLWRYAGLPKAPSHDFDDVDRHYQNRAVAWMLTEEITTGITATSFDPHAAMTRAEAATFMFRFGDPAVSPTVDSIVECTRTLKSALITGGLTTAEAACAAPWLTDFSVEYLTQVVADIEPASFELILAVAIVNDEGCVSERRMGELSRLYL